MKAPARGPLGPVLGKTSGIVAVEDDGRGRATLYRRTPGGLRTEVVEHPYVALIASPRLVEGCRIRHEVEEFRGGDLRFAVRCATAGQLKRVVAWARRQDPDGVYPIRSRTQNFLLGSGARLFQDLGYDDIRVLALAVAGRPSSPAGCDADDPIVAVALRDSTGWSRTLTTADSSEADLLAEVFTTLRRRDPDVIVVHHVNDLAYLIVRAERHGPSPELGRDGSSYTTFASGFSAGAAHGRRDRVHVWGRHVVETEVLVRKHDVGRNRLRSYDVLGAANALSIPGPSLSGDDWDRIDRGGVAAHARLVAELARCTLAVADRLLPTHVELAKLLPLGLEDVVAKGPGGLAEAALVGAAVSRGWGLPKPPPHRPVSGGASEVRRRGLIRNVVAADLSGLYASLMVMEGTTPAGDEAGIFADTVRALAARRSRLKAAARGAETEAERARLDAEQQAVKLVLNSCYGHLGRKKPRPFSDAEAADAVATRGRSVAYDVMKRVEAAGGRPTLLMTDGIYFEAPAEVSTEAEARALVESISAQLPEGIDLRFEGLWPAMLSVSRGNYALVDAGGGVVLKGGLRSRSLEPFVVEFMREAVRLLAAEDFGGLRQLYLDCRFVIRSNLLAAEEGCRSGVLQKSLDEYERDLRGGRRRDPHYEVARRARAAGLEFEPGDRVAYYLRPRAPTPDYLRAAGSWEWKPEAPDHDVEDLLASLDRATQVLRVALSAEDLKTVFEASEVAVDLDGVALAEPSPAGPVLSPDEHLAHAERIISTMVGLAEAGYGLAPTHGKKPIEKGFLDATLEPEYIRRHATAWAHYARQKEAPLNFALVCGPANDVTVIDIDALGAREAVDAFASQFLGPDDVVVRTGSGNLHVWCRHEPRLKNRSTQITTTGPVRVEAKSKRVLATGPGSINAETGRPYVLRTPADVAFLDALAARRRVPETLVQAVLAARPEKKQRRHHVHVAALRGAGRRQRIAAFRTGVEPHVDAANLGAVVAVARRRALVEEGGRTDDLRSFAGSVIRFLRHDAYAAVLATYSQCFHVPPLDAAETEAMAQTAASWKKRPVSLRDDIMAVLKAGALSQRRLVARLQRDRSLVAAEVQALITAGRVDRRGAGRGAVLCLVSNHYEFERIKAIAISQSNLYKRLRRVRPENGPILEEGVDR